MRVFVEPVSGGLVTARDPSTLQPGELQQAYACMYLPDTDSLWRQPGGSFWNTVASADQSVLGLVDCKFDSGNHYLVAHASGKLWTAVATADGTTFASATINTTGLTAISRMVSVPFNNRHYLFDGVNTNKVILDGGTARQHGLSPTTQVPSPLGTAVGSAFSASVTGYYEYWFTEVVKFSDNQELESAYGNPAPLTVNVTGTADAPKIELPSTPVNVNVGSSIYYNVYRSEMKENQNDSLYPIGRKVGIASPTNTAGTWQRVIFTDTTAATNTGVKTAGSNDTILASGVSLSTTDLDTHVITRATGLAIANDRFAIFRLHNFSLGTFTGNIVGISVNVTAKSSVADCADLVVSPVHRLNASAIEVIPPQGAQPQLIPGVTGGVDFSAAPFLGPNGSFVSRSRTITNTASYQGYTFGSSTDDFLPGGYSWKVSDFDSNFGIQIAVRFNQSVTGTETVSLDGVNVTVYYAATNSSTKQDQKTYDAIIVEESGVELKFGANGKPPTASTGIEFEGSLVTNDIANPNKLCWSVPGYPDYFPTDVYYMFLPGDGITFVGAVNNRLVVGQNSALYRINYLPNEDDASFSRGRAFERISNTVGILHPNAACIFTNSAGRQELVFVDANGVFATDAYGVRKLSQDLQWVGPSSTSVFASGLTNSIPSAVIGLLNEPRTQTVRLLLGTSYYAGSYAARHAKPGGSLKWTKCTPVRSSGGITYGATCGRVFRRPSGDWITVYAYASGIGSGGGGVCREDSYATTTINTLLDPSTGPTIKTREIYGGGIGEEAEVGAIVIHGTDRETGNSTKNIAGSVAVTQHFTNAANDTTTTVAVPGAVSSCRVAEAGVGSVNSDGVTLTLTPTTTGMFELHSLGMRAESFGEAELRA